MAKNNVLHKCEFSCSVTTSQICHLLRAGPKPPTCCGAPVVLREREGWRGQGSRGVRKDPGLPVGVFQVLIEDTDQLWHNHCLRDFKNEKPEEFESWREMYLRLHDAREQRLLMLARNIGSAHANKPKGGVGLKGLGNSRVSGNAAGGVVLWGGSLRVAALNLVQVRSCVTPVQHVLNGLGSRALPWCGQGSVLQQGQMCSGEQNENSWPRSDPSQQAV